LISKQFKLSIFQIKLISNIKPFSLVLCHKTVITQYSQFKNKHTMKNLKYLIAYILPIGAFISIYLGGYYLFFVLLFTFGLLPFLELIIPPNAINYGTEEETERNNNPFFDYLLYSHIPIMYGLIGYAFYTISTRTLSGLEITGTIFTVGIIIGTFGINIAHELGHRNNKNEQLLAKILLLPALYMHFFIEHNLGHHKNVATDNDPASSRKGEMIYSFWLRSTIGSYIGAWKLENKRLERQGEKNNFTWSNEMVRFQLIQLAYLATVGLVFNWTAVLYAIAFAIVGFLLLESVNYIEHYGLRRKQLANGYYETVDTTHSWNSSHELGRIFLYELTRHSDHHAKANKKYQILRHYEESPQLPFGYPGSILVALIPPVWMKIMERKLAVK
jgi:alkane 1-monooxygenase